MGRQPDSLPADEWVGTRFGSYEIESLIGVGGMGKVYRAIAADRSSVALKLVKRDLARDDTFRRRFAREARIAQTVHHPHVVPVHDAGEHDGIPYLAAELIVGVTLEDRLRLEERLSVEETVRICTEVAAGLQALAEAGMVHRDVKPANILLDRAGKSFLTDFGLAKVSDGSVLTRPGQPLGSMDYMSPEQIRGEDVTAAADVYSLGCVTYECLAGRPPFADRVGMAVLWGHLQDEPPDLVAQRADVPLEFAQCLARALRKLPAERPATAPLFAASLARAAGIPIAGGAR